MKMISNIVKDKILRLKSEDSNSNNCTETNDSNSPNINIFEGDKKICSINCSFKLKIHQARKLINNKIKDEFTFLDPDNDIENNDEKDMAIEDILQDETIKIKLKKRKTKKE